MGPYTLQVSKDGFAPYTQSGIVLEVNSNPSFNVILKVGSVAQEVVVEGSVARVETLSQSVGQVIDNRSVVDLPLNGRQATELIFLSGMATEAPSGDLNTNKNYPTTTISIAGANANQISFSLDGGGHNDPFNNLNMPIPFPDALQEFKVETSTQGAGQGGHAAGTVSVITKSGANQFHGDAFWFVRNYLFNARNFFESERDSLKRNQFGGTLGGPIIENKFFFFGGFQGTILRSNPPTQEGFVPTQAMRQGDFRSFASTACQGTARTLSAPFVNNQVSPSLFSPAALNVLKLLPVSDDPCGRITYGINAHTTDKQVVGKLDYKVSDKQQLFGRYFYAGYSSPLVWDGTNLFQIRSVGQSNQAHSFVLGQDYIISPTTLSSGRISVNRTEGLRTMEPYFSATDLGANVSSLVPNFMGLSVTGGISIGTGGTNPGYFNTLTYGLDETISMVRGPHQLSFGGSYKFAVMHAQNNRPTNGQFSFNGQTTGLGYSDFLLGNMSSFLQGNPANDNYYSHYPALFAQDNWKVNRHLSVNLGLRWEPYIPQRNYNNYNQYFDENLFNAGVRSVVYSKAPAGLVFSGDPGLSGKTNNKSAIWNFAPRIGVVVDPSGDGKMTIRASYGLFYDTPHLFFFTRISNSPPWGAQLSLTGPIPFDDPWVDYPGGNPFPGLNAVSKDIDFPLSGVYNLAPYDLKNTQAQTWNLSIQRQVGPWLLSGSYVGNKSTHLWAGRENNPAIYIPGKSTTRNTDSRRRLYLANPDQGRYYGTMGMVDDGAVSNYNALLLSVRRPLRRNVSLMANWTWSHCLADPASLEITGPTYQNPNDRSADYSNCSQDRRHVINISGVLRTPRTYNKTLNAIVNDWQLSPIIRFSSGGPTTMNTGLDIALDGRSNQRPLQVGPNPLVDNPSVDSWLNRDAFTNPAEGTYSLLRPNNIPTPSTTTVDVALSRIFPVGETRQFQFRVEAFNFPNILRPGSPQTNLRSNQFGQIRSARDPRIMQFAVKYVF